MLYLNLFKKSDHELLVIRSLQEYYPNILTLSDLSHKQGSFGQVWLISLVNGLSETIYQYCIPPFSSSNIGEGLPRILRQLWKTMYKFREGPIYRLKHQS